MRRVLSTSSRCSSNAPFASFGLELVRCPPASEQIPVALDAADFSALGVDIDLPFHALGIDDLDLELGYVFNEDHSARAHFQFYDERSETPGGLLPDQYASDVTISNKPNDEFFGTEPPEQWGTLVHGETGQREVVTPETGRWVTFYEIMRRAIEEDGPVPVSASQAYDTIRIVEAALTSSAMGCRIDLQPAAPPVSR